MENRGGVKNPALSANQGGKRYHVEVSIRLILLENFDTFLEGVKKFFFDTFLHHFFILLFYTPLILYIPKPKFQPNRIHN